MIIALGGKAGSGKSVVAKLLAKKLKFKHYSMGDLQREIAEQRNISIFELSKLEEENPEIDKEVDNLQISLGKRENNFIIDSRLGFHFIPKAKKIFLDCDFEVRAKRIFKDKSRKENNKNLDKAKENIKQREKSEILRYKKYYNVNPYDKKKYEFVIDTTNSNPEEIVSEIINLINKN